MIMFDDKIITEIEKSRGYEIALITTFNFDISFFERKMLNSLMDNDVKKIELFVDAGQLDKALQNNRDNALNKKYIVNAIDIKSSFHPKVILLLGQDRAKLIISSANITLSGYTLNNEIFKSFLYDKNNENNLNLINDAIDFFIKLNDLAYYKDTNIFDSIQNLVYVGKKNNNTDIKLIHSIDESINEQIRRIINDKVDSIDVAVPYYDKELLGLERLKESFECSNINLYIQNEKSTFPKQYNEEKNIIDFSKIIVYSKLKNNDKNNFYHGKVFRINTNNKSYILYGSSNCTLSALDKSYKNNGNVECNILEYGEKEEFDYFFNNFKVDSSKELLCNTMETEIRKNTNFKFKFGLRKEKIELYFSFKNKENIDRVIINDKELVYEYDDEVLVIWIPEETISSLQNIFEVSIKFTGKEEKFICWYIDPESIDYYRNLNKEASLVDIKITDDLEKYKKHIEIICRSLALTKDEYNEQIRIARLLNHHNNEEDEDKDEDEINDEFIIEQDLPDEYVRKMRDFSTAYLKSKMFSLRFFNGLRLPRNVVDNTTDETIHEEEKEKKHARKATSAEKRFERFMKNRIKDILNEEYVELVDYEHYKNNIGLILDTINEFKYKEEITDIFDDIFVIDSSVQLLSNLLNKDNKEEEDKETTILLALIIIVENHILNESFEEISYEVENENRELLKKLNERYNIREAYKDYIELIIQNLMYHNYVISDVFVEKYIRDLFDFKTKDELIEMLKNAFGETSSIVINNKELILKTSTYEIKKYFSYSIDNIISDIFKYSNYYNDEINQVVINIVNLKDDYESTADPVKEISFITNMKNKDYVKELIRKSGKIETEYKKMRL